MVYLAAGYKLTPAQAKEWCRLRHLYPPQGNISFFANRWLLGQGITRTQLLCCEYKGAPIFLVVTADGMRDDFEAFQENEEAREIKTLLELEVGDFVTVLDPYGEE